MCFCALLLVVCFNMFVVFKLVLVFSIVCGLPSARCPVATDLAKSIGKEDNRTNGLKQRVARINEVEKVGEDDVALVGLDEKSESSSDITPQATYKSGSSMTSSAAGTYLARRTNVF